MEECCRAGLRRGGNARAAHCPVRVEAALFRLLQQAQQLSRATDGAFDITVAPLVRCWGFMGGPGKLPAPAEIAEARARVGIGLVELNDQAFTIRFVRQGVMLDLGSIGKGYALDRAAGLLREAGVTSGLLHGGTSTVCALGAPPDAEAWNVAVPHPDLAEQSVSRGGAPLKDVSEAGKLLAVVPLKDQAMSVSTVWGKSFEADGRVYGHVIDPRKGEPVEGAVMAAVILPSATETDALSTALLVEGVAGLDRLAGSRKEMRALVVSRGVSANRFDLESRGISPAQINRAGEPNDRVPG